MIFLTDTKECFEKGLLQKTTPSRDLAKKSIKQARFFLSEAEDLIDRSKKEMAILALYNAFFHAARALLFKDGIKERSHFCVARYLEEMYVNSKKLDKKFLSYLDTVRDIRHETQYSVDSVEIEENLDDIYNVCEDFINCIEKIVQ